MTAIRGFQKPGRNYAYLPRARMAARPSGGDKVSGRSSLSRGEDRAKETIR